MILRFHLSGSTLFETESDCVPQIGSQFHIVTESYKKGLRPGSHIAVTVSEDEPPIYDFTDPEGLVVILDCNGYEVMVAGPPLPDDDD